MLFPEAGVVEGHPSMSVPVFLSGEKRQAVCTSTVIPPVKKVVKVDGDITQVLLNDYLYVIPKLYNAMMPTLSRSNYPINLSRDLDDAAVSLLINNGLRKRFPTPCDTWRSHNFESKETTQKTILEKKKHVDEELRESKHLLEDTLAQEITKKVLGAYLYGLPTQF